MEFQKTQDFCPSNRSPITTLEILDFKHFTSYIALKPTIADFQF